MNLANSYENCDQHRNEKRSHPSWPVQPGKPVFIERACRQYNANLTDKGSFLSLRKDDREMRLAPKHFVHARHLAEYFDVYFSPLVPAEIDGVSVLDFSQPGKLQTYVKSGLQFEMASFPEEDEATESYYRWFFPKAGDTIFDVGAHCGVSAYLFSKTVGPEGRVIAFEPDPVTFRLLVRNIERHKLTNVKPVQLAIAGTRGEAQFNSEESPGSGLIRAAHAPAGSTVTVRTVTLEDAFREWGAAQFCKIDIEGAELEVIASSADFLRKTPCHFAMDTNHIVDGYLTFGRIEKLFAGCGYETVTSKTGMKTSWARPVALSR